MRMSDNKKKKNDNVNLTKSNADNDNNEEKLKFSEYIKESIHNDIVDVSNEYTELPITLLIASILMLISAIMIFAAVIFDNIQINIVETIVATVGAIGLLAVSIYMLKQIRR